MIGSLSQQAHMLPQAGREQLPAALATGAHPCVNTFNIGRARFPNALLVK